jgi:hypothetical protein
VTGPVDGAPADADGIHEADGADGGVGEAARAAGDASPGVTESPGGDSTVVGPVPATLVLAPPDAGQGIVTLDLAVTAVFVVVSVLATFVRGLRGVAVVVDLLLFLIGTVLMLVALVRAAGRSRTHEIAVSTLFFLAGSAPRRPKLRLLGGTAVQVVVGAATAGARPYTSLAFGVLAPLWGLGMTGVWAARHGSFPPSRRGPTSRR